MAAFDLHLHGITVETILRTRRRRNCTKKPSGSTAALAWPTPAPGRLLRREDRPFAQGQADCPPAAVRRRHLVGQRQHPAATQHSFAINRERAIDYLNTRDRLYCFDGFAGWDPKYRLKVRVDLLPAVPRPVHAHHADPSQPRKQLADFGKPDYVDLQRRPVSGQSPHRRHDLEDQHRPQLRERRSSSSWAPNTPAR